MKKSFALLLVLALSMSSMVGCGKKPEAVKTDNINTENKGSEDKAPETEAKLSGKIVIASNRTDLETNLKTYAEEFMALHPEATVEFETIKDYETVVATRVAGGEAPDLFYVVEPINSSTYGDYFLPINDLAFTADDILFYENGKGDDGNLYVLPLTVGYAGMIYNKQAFKAAGIDKVPLTLEEFWAACDKLAAAGITPVGTAFKDVWPIYPWCGWSEVNVAAGDVKGQHKYPDQDEIYDETMLTSMNIIRDLYGKGYLEKDVLSANWDQFKLDFAQAKTGMFYSETWLPAQFVELGAATEDIGMFPFPGSKNIKSGAGKQWGISKNTKSPELAKAFLTYMLEKPVTAADIPSNVNLTVADPFVAELLSYGVEPLSEIKGDARMSQIINEIEIDGQAFLLTYVMEQDDEKAKALIDAWNKKWAAARKAY